MKTYKIVRGFSEGGHEIIATGLSLRKAKEHCRDKETSSRTCSDETLQEVGASRGAWFDGYEEE
jgi:hypothetical protein